MIKLQLTPDEAKNLSYVLEYALIFDIQIEDFLDVNLNTDYLIKIQNLINSQTSIGGVKWEQ